MDLIIINCSPRKKSQSNTSIILHSFLKGYTSQGYTAKVFHLSEKKTWNAIRTAFYENHNILMALPLYVECIPGIMAEFLETLTPKAAAEGAPRTKLSFLLQGGFEEASQLRCGEKYLEQLPGYLNCDYNGTLIKGGMFITHMLPSEGQKKAVKPFYLMGKHFAIHGSFEKAAADEFAGREYYSKAMILFLTILRPVNKLFFHIFFKKMGCKTRLAAKPYKKYLKNPV